MVAALTPDEQLLVVANLDGQLVKLGDIAQVELGPEDERSALRYKGTPAVAIGVVRQSKANIIEVAEAIHAELPRIQQTLPPGVRLDAAFDQSVTRIYDGPAKGFGAAQAKALKDRRPLGARDRRDGSRLLGGGRRGRNRR